MILMGWFNCIHLELENVWDLMPMVNVNISVTNKHVLRWKDECKLLTDNV